MLINQTENYESPECVCVCVCVCVFIKQSFGFLSTDKSVINQSNQESACDSNPSRLNFNKHSTYIYCVLLSE